MEDNEPLWRWPQKISYFKPAKEYLADLIKSTPWIILAGSFMGVIGYWEQGGTVDYGLIIAGCFFGAFAGIRYLNDARESRYIHYRISRMELYRHEIRHTFLFMTKHYSITDIMSCPKYRHDTESFHFIYKGRPVRTILRHIPEDKIAAFTAMYAQVNSQDT